MTDVETSGGLDQLGLSSLIPEGPAEDVGAQTQARFRYQSEVIARDVLSLLLGGAIAVICEWEEDAIVVHADLTVELVSVKHREPSQGAWSRAALIADGGVRHLFTRWQDTGERARCRVSTNGGLKSDAEEFRDACASEDPGQIALVAHDVCGALSGSEEASTRFLSVLRIEDGLPHRDHITAVSIQELVRPALTRLKLRRYRPEAVYEALVRAVETASRDRSTGSHEFVDIIADPRRLDGKRKSEIRLKSRTLLRDDARLAVAAVAAADRPMLVPGPLSGGTTVLEQKLKAGGFAATAINAAKRLRAVWAYFEAQYDDPFSTFRDEVDDLTSRVQSAAGAAETEARASAGDQPYGPDMYMRLRELLRADALAVSGSIPVEEAHLEGLAYELTDRCQIWWSPEFQVGPA